MERPKKNSEHVRTRYTKEFKLEAVRPLKPGQTGRWVRDDGVRCCFLPFLNCG